VKQSAVERERDGRPRVDIGTRDCGVLSDVPEDVVGDVVREPTHVGRGLE
jgi:hypothetical protein